MSLTASCYGRLVKDPIQRTTASCKPMSVARLAVDVTGKDTDQQTMWLDLLCFDEKAETLARHMKGDMIGATGRVTRTTYEYNGETREQWSMMCDAFHSSRTVRPGGRKTKQGQAQDSAGHRAQAPAGFDDEIPFG